MFCFKWKIWNLYHKKTINAFKINKKNYIKMRNQIAISQKIKRIKCVTKILTSKGFFSGLANITLQCLYVVCYPFLENVYNLPIYHLFYTPTYYIFSPIVCVLCVSVYKQEIEYACQLNRRIKQSKTKLSHSRLILATIIIVSNINIIGHWLITAEIAENNQTKLFFVLQLEILRFEQIQNVQFVAPKWKLLMQYELNCFIFDFCLI